MMTDHEHERNRLNGPGFFEPSLEGLRAAKDYIVSEEREANLTDAVVRAGGMAADDRERTLGKAFESYRLGVSAASDVSGLAPSGSTTAYAVSLCDLMDKILEGREAVLGKTSQGGASLVFMEDDIYYLITEKYIRADVSRDGGHSVSWSDGPMTTFPLDLNDLEDVVKDLINDDERVGITKYSCPEWAREYWIESD